LLFKNKKERQIREGILHKTGNNDKEENRKTEQNSLQRGVVSVTNYKTCTFIMVRKDW